jgi:hypothetical protein
MGEQELHVVTGSFGYSGRHIPTIDISDNYPQNANMGKIDFPISSHKL